MKDYKLSRFKDSVDGKAAIIIWVQARRMRRQINDAVQSRRIKVEGDVKRILDFCEFLAEPLELPTGLSVADREFYQRSLEKLVARRLMPTYVLDVLKIWRRQVLLQTQCIILESQRDSNHSAQGCDAGATLGSRPNHP